MPPVASVIAATASAMAALSVTSSARVSAEPPSATMRAATASMSATCAGRSQITTRAPAAASPSASAAPMPRLAPVTSAVLPVSTCGIVAVIWLVAVSGIGQFLQGQGFHGVQRVLERAELAVRAEAHRHLCGDRRREACAAA